MRDFIRRIFLNDHVILSVILLNAVVIYLQESGISHPLIIGVDVACTLIFLIEMLIKHLTVGVKEYWRDGWNRMDGILVIISLPSLITPFFDASSFDFSILLTLRLMRVLRFFRVLHFFPNFTKVVAGFKRAMRESYAILLSFLVIIVIFALVALIGFVTSLITSLIVRRRLN